MKNLSNLKPFIAIFFMIAFLLISKTGYAQGHENHHHNDRDHNEDWPDSLTVVTVSGQAKVDSNHFHSLYFLDEGNDGSIDFQLGFGPYWYEPESGATRPNDGETVSIKGGMIDDN